LTLFPRVLPVALVGAVEVGAVVDGAVVVTVDADVGAPDVCATTGVVVAAAAVEDDDSSEEEASFDAAAGLECA